MPGSTSPRVGAVAQRVGAQVVVAFRHRHPDLRRAIDFGCLECRGAENVVEVVVRQHDMADCAASHGMHVSGDRPRLWQRRTTVDQRDSVPTADQAHGDVEKRKTATEHAVGPAVPSRGSLPQREWLRRAVLLYHLRRRVRRVRRCHSERPRRRRILL